MARRKDDGRGESTGSDRAPSRLARLEGGRARRLHERNHFDAEAGRPDEGVPAGTDRLPEIRHIVVVMMENHSYDSYLGAMTGRGDGLVLGDGSRRTPSNPRHDGRPVGTHRLAATTQPAEIPCQSWEMSHAQWNNGAMDGFVRSAEDVAARCPEPVSPEAVEWVMGHWVQRDLPFYWSLAQTFPVADRWFGSCLGPTFPNRRFLVAATAHGLVTDEASKCLGEPPSGTIFDLLTRHGISWTNYHSTSPTRVTAGRLLGRRGRGVAGRVAPGAPGRAGAAFDELESKLQFTADVFGVSLLRHIRHVRGVKRFFADVAEDRLPAFSIVDPSFVDFSEETPQDVQLGERFAGTVIDAVMHSPVWPSTVLIWCYDEHGGYFDHVAPPAAVEPDDVVPNVGGDGSVDRYDRYGVRVPAVIVSPFARPATVVHETFDHTSILRLVEDKWNLPSLTRRDAAANSPLVALDLTAPPAFLVPPDLDAPALGYARPPGYDFLA